MEKEREILDNLILSYPRLCFIKDEIAAAYQLIEKCYTNNGIVLTCGNGGSAADSEHIVGELMKGFRLPRKLKETEENKIFKETADRQFLIDHLQGALPAISLASQSSFISAYANDVNPDMVFAQQVYAYGNGRSALLLALSTSGNSKNVAYAVQTAIGLGMDTIGITGEKSSRLDELCNVCIKLPATQTFEIQELTLPIYHALCAMTEVHFFN